MVVGDTVYEHANKCLPGELMRLLYIASTMYHAQTG